MEEACRRRLPACLPCRCPCASWRAFSSPSAGCSAAAFYDHRFLLAMAICMRLLRTSSMHQEFKITIMRLWLDRQGMTDEMSTSGGQSMHTIEELERNIYRPRHACVAFRAANNNWGHKENVGYENVARCVPHKKKTSTSRTS